MPTLPHELHPASRSLLPLEALLTRPAKAVRDGVLDFIDGSDDDYCSNFGDQWNRFRTVQIDSLSGADESRERFFAETGWTASALKDKLVLDAGCGAGRFAEVALQAGCRLVAVDMSRAAYACRRTLDRFPEGGRLVIRANLFDLPLPERLFDGIYSLGVLQHTPDPLGAIRTLARMLAPGGRLATWIYEKPRFDYTRFQPRTWIRAAVRRWPDGRKLALSRALTAVGFPAGWLLSWLGRTGERAAHFLPYASRHHLARGSLRKQWDYSVMDTFDWYGPLYDAPQSEQDVMNAMQQAGLVNVRRLKARGMAIAGEAPGPP